MTDSPPRASRTMSLFFLFQALYGLTSSGNVFRVPDEFETYFQAEHLFDAGDMSVPQTLAITQRKVRDGRVVGQEPVFFGTVGLDGKPYAPYGPLVAVLALPHHLLGRAIAWLAGVPRRPLPGGIAWLIVVGGITMLATATAGGLAVAGFYRAALATEARPDEALKLSLLLGGATVLWPYGTNFFSEAFQAAAFAWAAALLLELSPAQGLTAEASAKAVRSARVLAAAMLILVAGLTKVTALVFAPAFPIAALAETQIDRRSRWKTALALSVAIGTAAAIHAMWNVVRFGDPLNFGYDWSETVPQLPARAFLLSDIPRGLFVLLASPGKSILIWAPPLLLSLLGLRAFWRAHRALSIGILVATATGLLFFSAYLFPEGGYSHGPRNLVPILPLVMLPAIAAGVTAQRRQLAMMCGIAGFAVALTATSVSYLDDQSIGADVGSGARSNYYERVTPEAGRASNRYQVAYIPFAATLATPGWIRAPTLGQGPDYFPLHLIQARRQLSDGATIPLWLVVAIPATWLILLFGSVAALNRR